MMFFKLSMVYICAAVVLGTSTRRSGDQCPPEPPAGWEQYIGTPVIAPESANNGPVYVTSIFCGNYAWFENTAFLVEDNQEKVIGYHNTEIGNVTTSVAQSGEEVIFYISVYYPEGHTSGGLKKYTLATGDASRNPTGRYQAAAVPIGPVTWFISFEDGDDDVDRNFGNVQLVVQLHTAETQKCDCNDDWKNHGEYVKCVVEAAKSLVDEGSIAENEIGRHVSLYASNDCGKK